MSKTWEIGRMRKADKQVTSGRGREWKEHPNAKEVNVLRELGYQSGEQVTGSLGLSENPLGLGTGCLWGGPTQMLRAWSLALD